MIVFYKKVLLLLTLIFISLFLLSGIVECKDTAAIILVKGVPKIMKQGSATWDACAKDMAVNNGDRIKTLKGEAVEISFAGDNKRIVKIGENSEMYIRKNESPYSIELVSGEAMALLEKLPKGSTFEIRTPTGISGARGTGWGANASELKSIFKSFENVIYVKGIDAAGNEIPGELEVREGWQSIVDKFEKPGALEKLESGDREQWNEWKNDVMERLENLKARGSQEAGSMQEKIERIENKFEEAAQRQSAIQKMESKKESDFRDARDSDTIKAREDAPSSERTTSSANDDSYTPK